MGFVKFLTSKAEVFIFKAFAPKIEAVGCWIRSGPTPNGDTLGAVR
jgi:hypothetical protein